MDQFRLFFRNVPAGPVRASWEEAAQDAVAAGLATWVREGSWPGLTWSGTGAAAIVRITTPSQGARTPHCHAVRVRPSRRARIADAIMMIGAPCLPALASTH